MTFHWQVFLDVGCVAFLFYRIFLLIKGTQAAHVVTGILLACALYLLSALVPLITLNWLLSKFYPSLILILTVLFQEEIRRALSQIGKKSLFSQGYHNHVDTTEDIVVRTAEALSEKKVGALIVCQQQMVLSKYENLGLKVDALLGKELLSAIFQKSSSLHDGAVILAQGRIVAAGCLLPLSRRDDLSPIFGTRHRAALGLSEETDALVVVVSEERGTISLARGGELLLPASGEELRALLQEKVQPQAPCAEGDMEDENGVREQDEPDGGEGEVR